MNTLVSVIIPAYRCEKYLEHTVRSALAQSYANLEVIVVDDCSPDKCGEIADLLALEDKRVKCIHNPVNQGVAQSRNIGVAAANGEWIAFLDGDDYWAQDKLIRQLKAAKSTPASLYYTGADFISEENPASRKYICVAQSVDYKQICKGNDIITSSVLVKRDYMLEFPMERSDLHEDFIAWLRILARYGQAAGIDLPLTFHRLYKTSKSGQKLKSAKTTWKTYKYMGWRLPKRIHCFSGYVLHGLKRYWM